MNADTARDLDWALNFARAAAKDTQAGKAFRVLADALLELRGENKALRGLVGQAWPGPTE